MTTTELYAEIRKIQQTDGLADQVGYSASTKTIILRRGFFYTHGQNSKTFVTRIVEKLTAHGLDGKYRVVDSGEVWKSFNGGAKLSASSHWFCKLQGVEE